MSAMRILSKDKNVKQISSVHVIYLYGWKKSSLSISTFGYKQFDNTHKFSQITRNSLGRSAVERFSRISPISQVVDLVVALLFLLPEGEVLLEELNDGLGITEVVLLELINAVESLLEGGVGKGDGRGLVLHDFVMEDGEVKGKTELDWVAGWERDLVGLVVSLESLLLDLLELGVLGALSDVAVVIADHLDEESLGLILAGRAEHLGVDDVDDVLAVSLELGLNGALVGGKSASELGVLRVLLDGGNGSASSAFAGDEVLEGDREEVALIGVDRSVLLIEDLGEEVNHVVEALGLLGDTGEENVLFGVAGHGLSLDSNFKL